MMNEPGYEMLAQVLQQAYDQAATGKGKERHAENAEPFHKQLMQSGAQRFGVGALLFQAYKKSHESQRMDYEAAKRELLGAIVYLAGAVIARAHQEGGPVGEPILVDEGTPKANRFDDCGNKVFCDSLEQYQNRWRLWPSENPPKKGKKVIIRRRDGREVGPSLGCRFTWGSIKDDEGSEIIAWRYA